MSADAPEPLTFKASDHLSLRLYPDSRPHFLETASLQKGLVLVLDGEELIEEGMGLGTPVVRYFDHTYFPGSARTSIERQDGGQVFRKTFFIDSISRVRIWKGPLVDARLYSDLHLAFARAYVTGGRPNRFLTKLIEMRKSLGLRTQFVKTRSKGRVTVTYALSSNAIQVQADLRDLQRSGCKEILVMNEAGPAFFARYDDRNGLELMKEDIGAWNRVEASEASLSDFGGTLHFSLSNTEGGHLYRGWERVKGGLSWAGLNYSIEPWKPVFEYSIRLGGSKCG